jgi:2-dehydropantoate 2-reductase
VATSSIGEVSEVDLILVCVKTWQLPEVAQKIKPIVQAHTRVISLLNGVENQDILTVAIPAAQVFGGLCKIVSFVEAPGLIRHASYEPTIVFGPLDHQVSPEAQVVEKALLNAGINTILTMDIYCEIWTKFLFITTVSALGALTRATIGEMCAQPSVKALMRQTAQEIVAVARAQHIPLPDDCIDKQFEIIESQPFETTASLQRDFLAGRPSELEAQNGAVVRYGKALGIPTPVNAFIYHCLLPQELKNRT